MVAYMILPVLRLSPLLLSGARRTFTRHAATIDIHPEHQETLRHGEERQVGNCVVTRHGDMLRMERLQESGNIQSEWDIARGCAPDYAGTIADLACMALARRQHPHGGGRVLMLGLGGGTVAGHVLFGPGQQDLSHQITAVEADADVAEAACRYFVPHMFASSCVGMAQQQQLRVLHADAFDIVEGRVQLDAKGNKLYDVLIEDFAYEEYGALRTPFWRSLRTRFAMPAAVLLVNTLYSSRREMSLLERDLRTAGWTNVVQRVDRGLQASEHQSKRPGVREWQPNDNMIFSATNGEER